MKEHWLSMEILKTQRSFSMGATSLIKWDGTNFDWTGNLRFIPASPLVSSSSYITPARPATSSTTNVFPSGTRTWTASGIALNAWEVLYLDVSPGAVYSSHPLIILDSTASAPATIPSNWLLIAAVMTDDGNNLVLGNGTMLMPWKALTLSNSWVNYDSTYNQAEYRKDSNGIVYLRGLVKSGTTGTLSSGGLPTGYRPQRQEYFVNYCNNGQFSVDVTTAGTVSFATGYSNVWSSIDNIKFQSYQ